MIRRATYADVPELRRLFKLLVLELEATRPVRYPEHTEDDLDAFTLLTARRIADPLLLCYIALDDATGEGLAFLGGEVGQRLLGQPRIFGAAHWLYVMPHARTQGLARALVRRACEDLVEIGITHVELAALRGDMQWATRGWIPYLIHHVLPIEAVIAGAAERPVTSEAPPAPEPPPRMVSVFPPLYVAPAPAPEPLPQPVAVTSAPRRHRRRPPPPPARAAWNGA